MKRFWQLLGHGSAVNWVAIPYHLTLFFPVDVRAVAVAVPLALLFGATVPDFRRNALQ